MQAVQPGTLASTATPCANANWEPLTDELSTQVTQLTFDTAGSKCIAFIPANYVPTDSTTYTQWTTASGSGAACDPGASNAPSPYPDTATHHFVETRQVNITLAGQQPDRPDAARGDAQRSRADPRQPRHHSLTPALAIRERP